MTDARPACHGARMRPLSWLASVGLMLAVAACEANWYGAEAWGLALRPGAESGIAGERLDIVWGGSSVTPETAKMVVGLDIADPAGDHYTCGGALIARDLVLTAGHCLSGESGRAAAVEVVFDTEIESPRRIKALKYWLAPGFEFREQESLNDLGLIRLTEPVPSAFGYRILPLADSGLGNLGDSTAVLGFGLTDPVDPSSYGHLRGASLRVWDIGPDFVTFNSGLWAGKSDRAGVCHGDSGSPALIKLEDGTPAVLGIVIGGRGPGPIGSDSSNCGSGRAIRPSSTRYLDWIRQSLQ